MASDSLAEAVIVTTEMRVKRQEDKRRKRGTSLLEASMG